MSLPSGIAMDRALRAAGVHVPDECALIELLAPPDGVLQLRYTVNATPDTLRALAAEFVALAGADTVEVKRAVACGDFLADPVLPYLCARCNLVHTAHAERDPEAAHTPKRSIEKL